MKTFKTAKGTTLPLLDLRGKPYLQVAHRVLWMREEKPLWKIATEMIHQESEMCIFKATIMDEEGGIIAMAHKQETAKSFPDFIEKCESSAIGRALGFAGFGTQFAGDDLEEGDRLADSPIATVKLTNGTGQLQGITSTVTATQATEQAQQAYTTFSNGQFENYRAFVKTYRPKFKPPMSVCEGYKPTFGKHKGRPLRDFNVGQLKSYVDFLVKPSDKGTSNSALEFIDHAMPIILNGEHAQAEYANNELDQALRAKIENDAPWPESPPPPDFSQDEIPF